MHPAAVSMTWAVGFVAKTVLAVDIGEIEESLLGTR